MGMQGRKLATSSSAKPTEVYGEQTLIENHTNWCVVAFIEESKLIASVTFVYDDRYVINSRIGAQTCPSA